MPGLTQPEPATLAILDHRLAKSSDLPIALGLSGGSDSVALALMTSAWAKSRGRTLHLLTVDHQLNPDSGRWNQSCAELAERLEASHHLLVWTAPKPSTGLPASARLARHRLLANRAREIGAKVILLGHTADDRAEGHLMRQAGSTIPDPREWVPSPVWPEGRGVFILRPMLDRRRSDLRQWLAAQGEAWIEDPANENMKFARARARAGLDPLTSMAPPMTDDPELANLAAEARFNPVLTLPRVLLRQVNLQTARMMTGIACLCVSGGSKPPRGERLVRLVDQLLGGSEVIATLVGARIEADDIEVRWMRNPGELKRRAAHPTQLQPGLPTVWDGRYEITSSAPRMVVALQGQIAGLSTKARQQLRRLPAAARGALPLVRGETSQCPILEDSAHIEIFDLTRQRFNAATGLVTSEAS